MHDDHRGGHHQHRRADDDRIMMFVMGVFVPVFYRNSYTSGDGEETQGADRQQEQSFEGQIHFAKNVTRWPDAPPWGDTLTPH